MAGCLLMLAVWLLPGEPLAAADLKPSWHCLPEETVVLARMPQPREFYEAIRSRTKLGAVVLKQDRMDKAVELIREQAKDGLADFEKSLGDLNLKIDDWQAIFSSELGIAMVVQPRGEAKYSPLLMLLAWVEPGEDLAARMLAAVEKGVAEQKETKFPTRRIDLELAGHNVLYLVEPQTRVDDDEAFEDLPEDFGKFTPEQRRAWQEKQRKKLENAKRVQTGQQNVFLTRLGSRLLLGMTIVGDTKFKPFDAKGEQAIDDDFDNVSGVEEAKGVFARFLESHGDDSPAATLKLFETPGLQQSLPEGLPLLEVLADPRPLWKINSEDAQEAIGKLKAYGVDGIGPVAYRQTLDGNVARSGMFISIPSPRRGLLSLLDQPAGPSDVPGWVSRETVQYEHIHFDLGKAYTTIKEVVLAEEGDKAKSAFDTVETQAKTFLQTDVTTLLGSLGTRHAMLTFMPKLAEQLAKLNKPNPDPHALPESPNRIAFVWQLKDEAIWQKILQAVSPFAGGNVLEEQGFKGLRAPGNSIGAFVGHGYLVVGTGEGTLETTFTALRNPPQGEAALKSSSVVQRANELLAAQPSMVYQVLDGARYGKLLGQLSSFFAHVPLEDVPAAQQDFMKGLQSLLPADEELEGILGVGAMSLRITDEGVVARSASEMPAP